MKFDSSWLTLYLIADSSQKNLLTKTEEALKGGVTLVQLRMKNVEGKEFFEMARAMKRLCDQYEVPFLINDRIDIALAVDATGVHVGQSDIPVSVARRLLGPEKVIGITGRTKEEIQKGFIDGANYAGVGAFTFTETKPDCSVLTIEEFKALCKESPIPLVGIGGITSATSKKITQEGAAGVSVCSAILGAMNIKKAAAEFLK